MINDIITIDLGPFGGEGIIELSRPTFRRIQQMKNLLGKCMGASIDEIGNRVLKDAPLGDMEIIKMMAYVKSAPFQASMDNFLNYCDRLDDKRNGSALELFALIKEKVAEIEVAPGPLDH